MIRRLAPWALLLCLAAPLRAVTWLDFDNASPLPPYMTVDSTQWFKANFYSLPGAVVNRTTWTNIRAHSGAGSAVVGFDYDFRNPTVDANFWGVSDSLLVSVSTNLSSYAGLTMYVYVESAAPANGNPAYPVYGKVYVKTGAGFTWYNGALTTIVPDQWTKVQVNFAAGYNSSGTGPMVVPNVNDVREFGFQLVGGDYDRGETRVFVDTIELGLGDDVTAPATPLSLSAFNPATGNRVNLSWTTVADSDLDHYNVYRSTAAGFTATAFNRLRSVAAGTNSLADESVVDGIVYRYKVTSVDKSGNESPATSEGSATPSGPAAFDLDNKGMTYVSWSTGAYLSTDSMSSLDDLMSTGANYVALVVTWYMTTGSASTIVADFANRTPTDAAVVKAIQDIHARGMKVLLKPHVDVNDLTWRGAIHPVNRAGWFASYASFINHYASIAQANGVEALCVGTELKTMTDSKHWFNTDVTTGWRTVISGVRSLYPSGQLTYAANSNHPQDEYSQIEFWDALDYVGLNTWWKLSPTNAPTVDQIKTAWSRNSEGHTPLQTAVNWRNYTGKNFFITELGARSANGTNMAPAEYNGSPGLDLQEQADVYEANFAAWNHRTWVKGLFWWHWDPNPNGGGKYNDYYVPNDKSLVLNLLTQKYGGESTGSNFRYTFEGTTHGWNADYTAFFGNNLSTPTVSGTAHGGSGSAAYPISFADAGSISDLAIVDPSIRKDLADYKGLKIFVQVPNGVISDEQNNPLKVALVVQTGPTYSWFESNTARTLSSGQWREVSIDFRSAKTGAGVSNQPVTGLTDVRRIGLAVFGAGATNGASTFYVDDLIARATWTVVGLSLNTTTYVLPSVSPTGSTVSLTSLDFENSGNTNVRYHLLTSNSSPAGWTPSTTAPGAGTYVLNGMFNSARPAAAAFVEANHALTVADQTSSASKFNGDQLGSGVTPGSVRNLWFEFRAPSVGSAADVQPQTLTIGILAEIQ